MRFSACVQLFRRNPLPNPTSLACDYVVAPGEHCAWKCDRCGSPWYAADGACPDDNCKHTTELPQTINYGKAYVGTPATANTIEDRVMVPKVPAGEYVLREPLHSRPRTLNPFAGTHGNASSRRMAMGLRSHLAGVDDVLRHHDPLEGRTIFKRAQP